MKKKKFVIYYVTEDLNNEKERNELEFLRLIAPTVVVTESSCSASALRLKKIKLRPQSAWLKKAIYFWMRLCLLLCSIGNSKMDRQFADRNIYMGNNFLRILVNYLWRVKNLEWINSSLPAYDTLYFAPIRISQFFFSKRKKSNELVTRLVIHDALLVRMNTFAPFIAYIRNSKIKTIANVKSWDNPFYTQIATNANGYLVWSDSMWRDIERTHNLKQSFVKSWGARPFFKILLTLNKSKSLQKTSIPPNQSFSIGYAAAFCDEIMAKHEVELIKALASYLRCVLPSAFIYFRPYPTLSETFYQELTALSNVAIVAIAGEVTDRFGDKRELIRFGSDEERIDYLSKCNCFLSMATSFTIEAAIYGLPIVHLFLPKNERQTNSEKEIFRRIDISDHLLEYFLNELPVANSYCQLADMFQRIQTDREEWISSSQKLLERLGVPATVEPWMYPNESLCTELRNWSEN